MGIEPAGSMLPELEEAPDSEDEALEEAEGPSFTANQLVAYNLQRARKARGWSQEDLGSLLGFKTGRMWSKASVSAAETSWRPGRRPRKFDANEVLAFARVLRLPVGYFYLPPDQEEFKDADFLVDDAGEVGVEVLHRQDLMEVIEMLPMPAEYVDRVRSTLRQQLVEWEPATVSRTIPMGRDDLARVVGQLRASGVDVREVLDGLDANEGGDER